MAERVVDDLEVVEVETEYRRLAASLHMLQGRFDMLTQLHAVRQSGQRIVMRQECDLLLRVALLGHVHVDGDRAPGAQRRSGQCNDAPVLELMLEAVHG